MCSNSICVPACLLHSAVYMHKVYMHNDIVNRTRIMNLIPPHPETPLHQKQPDL